MNNFSEFCRRSTCLDAIRLPDLFELYVLDISSAAHPERAFLQVPIAGGERRTSSGRFFRSLVSKQRRGHQRTTDRRGPFHQKCTFC